MGRVILIVSGKGGVGKTTVTANLGVALAKMGKSVCVVDADFSLNNLDVTLGLENRVVYDIVDVLRGKCRISSAILEDPNQEGLYLLPSVKESAGKEVKGADFRAIIAEIKLAFDFVLIDSPAGIDYGLERLLGLNSETLVVVTPTVSSLRDAKKVIEKLKLQKTEDIKFVLNRVRADLVKSGLMLNIEDVQELLAITPAGIIMENDTLFTYECATSLIFSKDPEIYEPFGLLASNLVNNTIHLYNYTKRHNKMWNLIKNTFKNIG